MAFPSIPVIQHDNLLRLNCRFWMAGQLAMNRFEYVVNSSATAEDLGVALEAWVTDAASVYTVLVNAAATFQDATLQVYRGTSWSQLYFSAIPVTQPVGGGNPMPPQVCGVLSRRCDIEGGRNRGRIYLPFPSTGMAGADHEPTSSYRNNGDALADKLINTTVGYVTPGGNTWEPCLVYDAGGGAWTYTYIYETLTHKKWGTQKRRGDYGTPNNRDS